MYNLAPKNAPWFEHLTDSVRSLGEAAHEWQLAHTGAKLAYTHAERGDLHAGKVTGQPGQEARGWIARPASRSPHASASFALRRAAMNHMHHLGAEYRHTAMLFATGAAWAVRAVHAGEQHDRVVFAVDDTDRRDLIPGSTHLPFAEALEGRYSGVGKLRTAHDRLTDCLLAGEQAEDIADQAYVADHEASQMFDLAVVAEGLADAAYAYGLLAERALQFVLLGPKQTHRVLLAEQRAAQEQAAVDETPTGGAQ
ncbi:hypothetical protein KVH22_29870 [Streptomyces olivaceus]|uniref:hypothetical protein n=1 Tax=Streptomyces olivaceus TaxID=47716 RepID=UPI001CCCDB29|nr:hypothetical protein [Streptomyces olivaceus]MBZ6259727.1 hypothetical protein [Streptomyces olivaceus]